LFRAAFTRGYIASQAYADKFGNKDIRPAGPKTPDFDTAPFKPQYEWLRCRRLPAVVRLHRRLVADASCQVDVRHDLDEPDVIAAVCRGGRARKPRAPSSTMRRYTPSGRAGSRRRR
jgi:hypothetical protein